MSEESISSHGTQFDFAGYGAGPYLLLSISQIEAVTPLESNNGVLLSSITSDGKKAVLRMSNHAAQLLIRAPEVVSAERQEEFELSVLDLIGTREPIEFPHLVEFVSLAIHPNGKFLLCFLDENQRHLCFSISSQPYEVLLDALRNMFPPV